MKELSYFSICPFSRATLLLFEELKIEYKPNELIDMKKLISKYHRKNNFFPIFEDSDLSLRLNSFLAINEYIFEKYGKENLYLYGEDIVSRAKIKEMIWWLIQDFYQNITSVIIYEKILKSYELGLIDKSPDSFNVRKAQMNLNEALFALQIKLKDQEFCASEVISFADFLLAAQISILDYMNLINWNSNLIYLKRWYLIVKSRPNFKVLLKLRICGLKPSLNYQYVDF